MVTVYTITNILAIQCVGIKLCLRVLVTFMFTRVLFVLSKAAFTPVVSTVILPIVVRARDFVCPVTTFLLAVTIMLFHEFLLGIGVESGRSFRSMGLRTGDSIVSATMEAVYITIIKFFTV